MRTAKVRGWEINYGVASAGSWDFVGLIWERLTGGWLFHFGVGRVLVLYLAWYK